MRNPGTEKFPDALKRTVSRLSGQFDKIPPERKTLLQSLTRFVDRKVAAGHPVSLHFICTHNSRRSIMAQIWAQTAARLYNIPHVVCISGGTEATAFNTRAVSAMRDAGFEITVRRPGDNPEYEVRYATDADPLIAFSKIFNDPFNRSDDFAAIMTCAAADENCPVIPGAATRIALPYEDPKDFDGTSREADGYRARVDQIGREMLFAFSSVISRRL